MSKSSIPMTVGKLVYKILFFADTQMKKHLFRLGVFFVCLFVLRQDSLPVAAPVYLPPHIDVQAGDWILRSGTAAESRIIGHLSQSSFSHIGMIVATAPDILVAHATTDDDADHPDQVLLSPIASFLAADKAEAFALVRPRFLNSGQRAQTARYAFKQVGKPFVLDRKSEPHFYCTTLILDAVRTEYPAFQPRWQYLDTVVLKGYYLFPQAFLQEDVEWLYDSRSDSGNRPAQRHSVR